jgi:hypothetical protein
MLFLNMVGLTVALAYWFSTQLDFPPSAQTGNVSVTFSRVATEAGVVASVTSESGDVDVKVGGDVSATFVIAANDVNVDKKLAPLHSGLRFLHFQTKLTGQIIIYLFLGASIAPL